MPTTHTVTAAAHLAGDSIDVEAWLADLLAAVRTSPEGARAELELEPQRLEQDYAQAWQALSEGDMVRATDGFVALVIRAPDQFRLQFGLGLCLQHFGQVADAGRHFGLAYLLDPSSAACAFRLGECLSAAGHREEAREALLTAVQLCDVPGADPAIRTYAQDALDRLA